jgi:hypothetical protein
MTISPGFAVHHFQMGTIGAIGKPLAVTGLQLGHQIP